jgi:hypothetical protein
VLRTFYALPVEIPGYKESKRVVFPLNLISNFLDHSEVTDEEVILVTT